MSQWLSSNVPAFFVNLIIICCNYSIDYLLHLHLFFSHVVNQRLYIGVALNKRLLSGPVLTF